MSEPTLEEMIGLFSLRWKPESMGAPLFERELRELIEFAQHDILAERAEVEWKQEVRG